MPGHDGTGPRGLGPITGKGDGYCVVCIPGDSREPRLGLVGLSGRSAGVSPSSANSGATPSALENARIRLALLLVGRYLSDLDTAVERLAIAQGINTPGDEVAATNGGAR